jgi:hypothetical protein
MGGNILSSLLPSLFGSIFGADEPTYQQPSMDQIQTPVQKALNDLLIERATSAGGWAKKEQFLVLFSVNHQNRVSNSSRSPAS